MESKAQGLVAFLRDYAQQRINSRLFDARRCIPPYVVLDFGREGLLGLGVPTALGGIALTWRERIPVVQQLAAIDLTLAMLVGIHNELGIGPILRFGQPQLQQELIPALARGQMLGGLAITEEGAGANPRAIQATAETNAAGGWRLNAQKVWVGNGSWAGVLNVFARVTEGRASRVLGFAVSTRTRGVRMGLEAMTMGMRGIVQSRVHFENVEVGADRLLGDAKGDLVVAEASFRMARLGIAIAASGAIKRCLQLLLRYGSRRSIATGALLEHPLFGAAVGDSHTAAKVLDRLTLLVADELDAGREVPSELFFVCKALAPEYLHAAADSLVQWLGGRGYIEANEAPQLLRDARLLRIFEGPTETMRGHLGSLWQHHGTLRDFLLRPGGSANVVAEMDLAAEQLWKLPRHPSMNLGQYTAARYGAIGEVVADGVAWWLLDTESTDAADKEWARRRFEASRRRGELLVSNRLLPLAEVPAALAADIGDITQTLPGEEWASDPLLA